MFNVDSLDGSVLQALAGKLAKVGILSSHGSGAAGTINITTSAGAPTSALKLPKGSLCADTTNAILYQTTDNNGTWAKVGLQT